VEEGWGDYGPKTSRSAIEEEGGGGTGGKGGEGCKNHFNISGTQRSFRQLLKYEGKYEQTKMRSQVLTAASMKMTAFWDTAPYSPVASIPTFRRCELPPLSGR
jgi:hypothetical protein